MEVRFANPRDKKQVLKLLAELSDEVNRGKPSAKKEESTQKIGGPIFDEIMKRKNTMIFVAVDNNKMLGLATFYLLPVIRHGWHRGHIEDFIVSKKIRGKGIGSEIMEKIKEYCRKNKIKVIKLSSRIENKKAHKFYSKHGGKHMEKFFRFDVE